MYVFKAFVFDGRKTAGKAYDVLDEYTPAYKWIADVAVVSRGKLGFTHIHSTWAQDDSAVGAGTGIGAVTGGLLGLLLGPGGALAGAAVGGSLGALFGLSDEIAFDDPRLDDFAAALVIDSSALILVGEEANIAEFAAAAQRYGVKAVKVIDANLDDNDIKALKKALKKA